MSGRRAAELAGLAELGRRRSDRWLFEFHDSILEAVTWRGADLVLSLNASRLDWPREITEVGEDGQTDSLQRIELLLQDAVLEGDGLTLPIWLLDSSYSAKSQVAGVGDIVEGAIPVSLSEALGISLRLGGINEDTQGYIEFQVRAKSMTHAILGEPRG